MMSLINYLKDIRKKGNRSFTLEQVMQDLNVSKNSALVAIHHLKKQGEIISPARGLYVIVPPEYQLQGSIPPEELIPILMKYLNADYYVSLLTAGLFHGASHQRPHRFQVISTKRTQHPLEFGYIKIEFIYKKSIAGLPINDVVVKTGYLKVATPELTAMDLLLYRSKSGGLNHIATVLAELVEVIDADKLIKLAHVSDQIAWVQRLGYILEKIETMEEKKKKNIIDKLALYLKNKMTKFVPLAPQLSRTHFPRSKKWMIIENTTIESDL